MFWWPYGDCPLLRPETFQSLIAAAQASKAGATLVTTVLDNPRGYGRILLDADGNVAQIVEQKACTPEQLEIRLVNSGIYVFRGDLLWKHIGEIEPNNPAHEYYLTDMAEILTRSGSFVRPFEVADPREIVGINTRVELAEVDRFLRDRKVNQLMTDGRHHRAPGNGDDRRRCEDRHGHCRASLRPHHRRHGNRRGLHGRRLRGDCRFHHR